MREAQYFGVNSIKRGRINCLKCHALSLSLKEHRSSGMLSMTLSGHPRAVTLNLTNTMCVCV